jgi:nitrate reductase assembly molybdenum cofactor insertion protein NarJ
MGLLLASLSHFLQQKRREGSTYLPIILTYLNTSAEIQASTFP